MKASIHAANDPRSRIGQIIGEQMYVLGRGKRLPDDFIIYEIDLGGTKWGVRPVQDYQEALKMVKKLNSE